METKGITIQSHPGAWTAGNLGDLANLADVTQKHSPEYAGLLRTWVETEQQRRQPTDVPQEPELLVCDPLPWSNAQLNAAVRASHAAITTSTDSSPRVRKFLGQLNSVLIGWAAARLEQQDKD